MSAKVVILDGPSQGVSILLPHDHALILGRHPECDLQFGDIRISSHHCRIFSTNESEFYIEDTKSTNGTIVNQTLIYGPCLLKTEDKITIGDTSLRFLCKNFSSSEIFTSNKPLAKNNYKKVGEYYILKKIGAGSTGEIFKAQHILSEEIMALKVLHLHKLDDVSMQRFLQEAKTCMCFEHPNIIKVHDFAIYYNRPIIVMEYINGQSLSRYIKSHGSLPLKRVLKIGIQIAKALHYAHCRNVVHRDLNPANILLHRKFQVKVIDFGIAKVYKHDITMGGQTLGTMNYIPPEQIDDARQVDHRADIYGLGATIYHALLGKPPYFNTTGINALTLRITEVPAQPLKELLEIPESVSNMIEKAMSPKREHRIQSIKNFLKLLKKQLRMLTI